MVLNKTKVVNFFESVGFFRRKGSASSTRKSHLQDILTSIMYYIHVYELTAEIRMKIEDRRK